MNRKFVKIQSILHGFSLDTWVLQEREKSMKLSHIPTPLEMSSCYNFIDIAKLKWVMTFDKNKKKRTDKYSNINKPKIINPSFFSFAWLICVCAFYSPQWRIKKDTVWIMCEICGTFNFKMVKNKKLNSIEMHNKTASAWYTKQISSIVS